MSKPAFPRSRRFSLIWIAPMIPAELIAAHSSINLSGRVDLQKRIFSLQGSLFFMPNPFRRSAPAGTSLLVPVLLLCLFSLTAAQASAQEAIPLTPFQKQMDRIDMAFGVTGIFSTSVSGIEQRDAGSTHNNLLISPSSTISELFTVRYTAKPLLGYEFNFGNSRYTQNFTFTPPLVPNLLQSAQVGAHELTLGYVAHTPKLFGVQPYLGAGGGTIRFKPTPGGGEGLPFQYRAAYYYSFGIENTFPDSHFGVRLGFRQLIYLAPDFQQNYLTITRRTRTSEPTFSFYLRF
jgi:hypothetical protein